MKITSFWYLKKPQDERFNKKKEVKKWKMEKHFNKSKDKQ